ncbi:FecR domain-containing protein [Sphingomonas canadensis]|uniref:FecR domain-containing protein n=1 Tax=Sphingomonas canadensis TaxID=1219257 RepID=A0ABW3H0Z1_9SPHN|nr:FecR domain-containing protein [Sphingomonas canadensis]MCW3835288.1 FecR domain-containing protein [Sphingomonas canadensis]
MRRTLGLVAVLMLAACGPQPEPAKTPAEIGAAVAVDPAATIATPPAPPTEAKLQTPVFANDRLATGPDGAIRVRFTDATMFSMGANSAVTIDSYVYDPQRSASSMSLNFGKGAFRFVSGVALHRDAGQVPVKTPVATIGVRGTAFNGVIGPEAETIWAAIDPNYKPDGGPVDQATLILLGQGAIDVNGSGVVTVLDAPGQVLFFRRPGAEPLGPILVTPWRRGQIEALGSPPSLGSEEGPPPAPSPAPSGGPPPTAPPAATPSPSPSASATPAPSPSPTPSASPTRRPPWTRPSPVTSPTPRPTARPTAKPTSRPTPTPRVTPSPRPTTRVTPRPTPKPTASPRPTPRPTLRAPVTRVTPRPSPTPTRLRATPRPTPKPTRPIG